MGAFDKVLSGIPALDQALDYIRMGDNVVWRVSSLEEFKVFSDPFVEQAKKDGRKIIYFRFARTGRRMSRGKTGPGSAFSPVRNFYRGYPSGH